MTLRHSPLGEGRVRVLIVIVLAITLLGKPTFAADKIRIGYSGMTISNALLWVTEEGKLFEVNDMSEAQPGGRAGVTMPTRSREIHTRLLQEHRFFFFGCIPIQLADSSTRERTNIIS